MAIGDEGQTPLKIVRKLSTSPTSLIVENHTLPMLYELHLENIVFGIFPLAAHSLEDVLGGFWPKNSMGDLLNMYIQALEVRLLQC